MENMVNVLGLMSAAFLATTVTAYLNVSKISLLA